MMSQNTDGEPRVKTVLLAAIAGLLALGVGQQFLWINARSSAEQSYAVPISYQPEEGMANPLRQRQEMIEALTKIELRLSAIESQLKGKLRVEVTNFPAPKAEGKE